MGDESAHFQDIFSQFFGGGAQFRGAGGFGGFGGFRARGPDLQARIRCVAPVWHLGVIKP